ncbi:PREDICTED: cell wall / vacuolar inhibitor of fructosidase 1-like [Ipomoea nil]|uniref:cell wall / vacuolar inhibitor of fructosidase 1-like n=1 Tax=Ipomoea nil TaxID=35883 RepID=UPI0009016484|nr:PREDICTED: cell wall / vacuolar inhibitor of fructosidase 1-like [Ipomoea nil]
MAVDTLFSLVMFISTMVLNKDKNTLITATCSKTPNYPLCVATLQSDPRSSAAGADIETLGLVMVSAVKARATEVTQAIPPLKVAKPEWGQPLSQCYFYYDAVLRADVPEAEMALKRGVPKFAEAGMADAAVEAASCDAAFKDNGITESPLKDFNKNVVELSGVATSIIKMLL